MSDSDDTKKKEIEWFDKSLTLDDGVELVSRIWAPKSAEPLPALLMRQPYGRAIASTVTYSHPSWWASKGYLVIIQDVRGQGSSTGHFRGFDQEAFDTSVTHNWVRSLPECNGKLGTYGFSYQGLTQLLAKPNTNPPDCLMPAMTGIYELEHWSCDGGAHWWHLGLAWGIQLAALQARRKENDSSWLELYESLASGSYLHHGKKLLEKHDPDGMVLRWLNQESFSDISWTKHKPMDSWLRKPMLLIGGWWDPHLKGILNLYKLSKEAGGSPAIHIGPATHLKWWGSIQQTQLNFLDKHLKGRKKLFANIPSHRFWNITTNKWETRKSFEGKKASPSKGWGLCSSGLACVDDKDGTLNYNNNGEGIVLLVHDPWRPVPSIGGHLGQIPGLANRSQIDLRCDVATFTTKPFKRNIYLNGMPFLKIIVEADQTSFDICVALSIVNKKNEEVNQLSTGFLRISVEEAFTKISRKIFLQPLVASIRAGEQLRISIAGAAWPAIGVNPGKKNIPIGPPSANCKETTLTFHLAGSFLKINKFSCSNF